MVSETTAVTCRVKVTVPESPLVSLQLAVTTWSPALSVVPVVTVPEASIETPLALTAVKVTVPRVSGEVRVEP